MFETEPLAPKAFVRESGDQVLRQLAQLRRATMKRPGDAAGRVDGGEHAKLVAAGDQLRGERVDVPVHAPRICPGVGRDYGYAHATMVTNVPTSPSRLGRSPVRVAQ